MLKLYLLLSLFFIVGIESKSFRILNDSSLANVDFRTYKIPYNAKNWNATGRLVVSDPFNACDDIKNGYELNGNIALVDKYTCSLKKKVERLLEFNVSAVVILNQQWVAQYAFQNGWSRDDRVCEIFTVSMQDLDNLKKTAQDKVLIVQLAPMISPWWELEKNGALVFFSAFFLLIEATGIGIAAYKSVCFWSVKKYRWSVPTTSLALLIGVFIVQIPVHLGPETTRGFYSIPVRDNIFTISFPFLMSVTLLIAFYWQAAISAVYSARFLPSNKKFLIPVGAICVLFFILEFIRVITNLTDGSSTAGFVLFFVYLVIIEAVALFYIASASRVLWFLRSTKSTHKTSKAKKLTVWLLISAVSYFVMPFFFGLVFVPPSADNASLFMTLFVADGLYHLVQFSLVMAFQAPKMSTSSSMERSSSLDKPSSTSRALNEDMASIELS